MWKLHRQLNVPNIFRLAAIYTWAPAFKDKPGKIRGLKEKKLTYLGEFGITVFVLSWDFVIIYWKNTTVTGIRPRRNRGIWDNPCSRFWYLILLGKYIKILTCIRVPKDPIHKSYNALRYVSNAVLPYIPTDLHL